MNLEEQSRLSYFKKIADISTHKNVSLVQHVETLQIFVKKELQVYEKEIYLYLMHSRSRYFPRIFECMEDEDAGTLILIEEYIQGETLEAYVQRKGKLPLPEVRGIMGMICEAVDSLHRLNPPFIHRDLKPSNMVLSKDGIIKIVDFNAARMYEGDQARDTVIIGTQHYAAPEQYGFRQSDIRTDIYALGVLMNYLLTGNYTEDEICPGTAGQIVRKCICFEPAGRFQNVGELAQALAGMDQPVPANRQKAGQRNALTGNNGSAAVLKKESAGAEATQPEKQKKKFPWLPPGFRTPKVWKMIVACFGYCLALYLALNRTWEADEIPVELHGLYRGVVFVIHLAWIFLWFNYGNIHSWLPIVRRKRWRLLGLLLYSFLILLMVCIIWSVVEYYFF